MKHPETAPEPPVHGGNLAAIGRHYEIDPASLLDFSSNLNPLGPPPALLAELAAAAADVAELRRYPDDYGTLRRALARQLDVEPDAIVVANGAAALLGTALAALDVRHCIVPTPAFSEYRHALNGARSAFEAVALEPSRAYALASDRIIGALAMANADACLLTNPHNPSGALSARETILTIARAARERAAATIVDEAFIDYALEASVTRDAASTGALVAIRSVTKFYAVPALRVGYAVCEPALARRMRAALPSWPVTTLAARAVAAALDDDDFAHRTRLANARERARLSANLVSLGFAARPSSANFLFVTLPAASPRAPEITARLIREERIVVRDCSSFDGLEAGDHLRIAVRNEVGNGRLVAALTRILS